ncbi:NAD(P)/FAD-dependent oxidoreductase [Leucobacter ruminantium]|uniref:FAD-dependent oxidoreductase n=1 Tax=Leucobacter ruminantium TaxID=1289170 RepID=A0A939LVM9_9MICO|nr:FAD-dependent oxidoreductase [Leucobacter ruminantium]MBO1804018.1 FAD-dependent oxidoreductase [Leucobacter ruminantium]
MSTRIVIVGGGLAAATAAEELRARRHSGSIDLVTAEQHRPYQRPPLSKGYLAGKEGLDAVYAHPDGWEAQHDIALHVGNPAVRIAEGSVELADGAVLPFDRLLLATGAQPRRLAVPGGDAHGLHVLRTLDDADRLRAALSAGGRRVVLVGAGWIGLELAAAARGYDNEVTVVSPDPIPLVKAVGPEMGSMFRGLHEQHGVEFLLGEAVTGIDTDESGAASGVITDRRSVPADVVIVGIGAVPDTSLAETAGLEIDGGVLVDEHLRTSAPAIYAAGDVANAFHPVLGARLRSEHWANAIAGGKVAGANMLGGDAVLDDIPYFYTDQYDLGMEYSGYASSADEAELVIRGDLEAREFVAFWVADGRVVAGMNVNVWEVNDQVQRLIRDRVAVDRARLADAGVDLREIA